MRRSILHADMNSFYATVEQHRNPELRGLPVAVAGDPERRNGIILAKSREAKAFGVKTAEAIWQARQKCPGLVLVPPDYAAYRRYSRLARMIYYDYTDLVEPFGLDESWLDITGTVGCFGGEPRLVAEEISERVKAELGITVSVGMSWNKVLAKLGSDLDPGDGIIEVGRDTYRDTVWPLPASDLIYVGPATTRKLGTCGIETIGDLACADDRLLKHLLGKMGLILRVFACGEDTTPVRTLDPGSADVLREVKSIGNGLTAPHDIVCVDDAKALIWLLAESVAQRLRECRLRTRTIAGGVRDAGTLAGYTRQRALRIATCTTGEIAHTAFELLRANEPLDAGHPLRALHVRASRLEPFSACRQLDLFGDEEARMAAERLDLAIDGTRRRFGNRAVMRLCELVDPTLMGLDIKADNVIHPVGYFGG